MAAFVAIFCCAVPLASADYGFGIGGGLAMSFPAMDIEDLPSSIIGLNVSPGLYIRSDGFLAMLNLSMNTSYLRVKAGETSKGGLGFGWGADVSTLFGKKWGFYLSPRFRQTALKTDAGNFDFLEIFTTAGLGYRSEHILFNVSVVRIGARPNAGSMLAFDLQTNVAYLF